MPSDADHMSRALHLAIQGRGRVEPNPMVGCVIVKHDHVIGEGYHQLFGGPHAEPNALAACTESPRGATAYVTLEPCCHTNKKTPPCVPRLIEAGIARVVLGATDPNPQVDGQGIAHLRAAGIEVTTGVLEPECRQLLAVFLARQKRYRPYVTLKWAESADRKVAGPNGARTQISNASSSAAVHRLRAACDSILVGINTILTDDPMLTARAPDAHRQPRRFIVDTHLRIPLDANVLRDAASNHPLIFAARDLGPAKLKKFETLHELGVQYFCEYTTADGRLRLDFVLARISAADRDDLLVEPGPTLARALFASNLVDRLWLIRSPRSINEPTAPSAADVPSDYVVTGQLDLDGDTLTEYLNPASPFFSAANPSADLLLEATRQSTAVTRI